MTEKIPLPEKRNDTKAERDFGVVVGESFPVSEILAAAKKNGEGTGAAPVTAISEAWKNKKPLKEKRKNGNEKGGQNRTPEGSVPVDPIVEHNETKTIPPELTQIFGDKVPRRHLETYGVLESPETKREFFAKLAADEAEKKKTRESSKSTKSRVRKPKAQVAEPVPEISSVAAMPEAEEKKEIPLHWHPVPVVYALEAEEQKAIDERIAAAHETEKPAAEDVVELSEVGGEISSIEKEKKLIPIGEVEDLEFEPLTVANAVTDELDNKKEPFIGEGFELPAEDVPEYIKESLNVGETRAGWKSKIRELVGKFGEGVGMSERGERMKAYLTERSKALGEKAKEYGANPEKLIRDVGEQYNKLSFKQKLLFGFGLGAGATIFSGVSTPLTLLFAGGLGIQRAGGMASMYLKVEGFYRDIKQGHETNKAEKVVAATLAVAYTVGMGLAIGEAVKLASESPVGEMVHEWLKNHYPFGETGVAATGARVSEVTPSPVPTVPEVAPPAAPEVSPQPVEEAAQVSELPKPEAPIAAAPVQTEVSIEVPAKPEVSAMPEVSPESEVSTAIPEATEVTPASELIGGSEITEGQNVGIDDETRRKALEFVAPLNPEAPVASIEVPVESVPANEVAPFDTTTAPVETPTPLVEPPTVPVAETPVPAPEALPVEPPAAELSSLERVEIPEEQSIQTAIAETPPEQIVTEQVAAEQAQSVVNAFGIEISNVESHIYADSSVEHLFVYGGSPTEQAKEIFAYLTEHPDATVYGANANGARVPWHLINGETVSGAPIRTSGFFGLFSSLIKAPSPEEFAKLIK